MGAGIIRLIMTLLVGIGAGKIADKIAPDANLNVIKPAIENQSGGFDFMKILKWVAVTVAGAILANFILKKTPLRKYKLFSLAVWLFGSALMVHSLFAGDVSGVIMGALVFTAPGGVGVPFTFQLNYLPEYLIYNHGGNQLTNLRIETVEDGVLKDMTAAQLNAENAALNVGALPANTMKYILADGHLKGKNVTISGVTSAVGAIPIFVSSDNTGSVCFTSSGVNVLALNDTEFTNFSLLFLPNVITATDRVQVFFKDGHTQIYDAVELAALSVEFQDAPAVLINNVGGNIDKVVVTSALGGMAYVLKVKL